jgi:dinuclear metal center YbgI/SA1388 family protein
MAITQCELHEFLNITLTPENYEDYCPNGLQIEGKQKIESIAFAVSATFDSIKSAVDKKADALIVHHGLFWKFHGTRTTTGPFAKRIIPLIQNQINLFGYHLPLDANMEIGNASSLGKRVDLQNLSSFGDYKGSPTGIKGRFNRPIEGKDLVKSLEKVLDHKVLWACPHSNRVIESLGIITGGANSDWKLAFELGLDAYITGEMSEHDWHESKESGIHMFAGGHNATEQFGIQALMELIKNKLDVECHFISCENPA